MVWSNETGELMSELQSGEIPLSAESDTDLRLRLSTNTSPNYTLTFSDHNGYEEWSGFELGFYEFDSSAYGKALNYLGTGPTKQTDLHGAFKFAAKHGITTVMIFGCQGGCVEALTAPNSKRPRTVRRTWSWHAWKAWWASWIAK